MTMCRIMCLSLILVLCVHGSEVVARIRFKSTQYTLSEGGPYCVPVMNDAAPADQDFGVSFLFDAVLIGFHGEIPSSVPRQGTIRFGAESNTSELCFPHFDDEIACESDIVGQVRLINGSSVIVIEPATATVTIKDDDSASVGFHSSHYSYSEGQALSEEDYPLMVSSHPSLPITMTVSQIDHSDVFVFPSLTLTDLTVSVSSLMESLPIGITDDSVALEAPEVVVLGLTVTSVMRCAQFNMTPYSETQITVVDNDQVTVGLENTLLAVSESSRSVSVCVRISTMIARTLEFRLSTQNLTALSGEDFTGGSHIGQFLPFSTETRLCYDIDVSFDSVVEENESFLVTLDILSSFPNEVSGRLTVTNTSADVIITDSSDCSRLVLDGPDDTVYYVPRASTVCLECAVQTAQDLVTQVQWAVEDQQLGTGDQFPHGRVLSDGALMITDSSSLFSSSPTLISCRLNHTQHHTLFRFILGVSPKAISLESSKPDDNGAHKLTCLYQGVPRPEVQWLQDNTPVEQTSMESVVPGSENRYKSELTLAKDRVTGSSVFACVCENDFGRDEKSITLRRSPGTGAVGSSGSKGPTVTSGLLFFSLLFLLVCGF